jgi:DNA polymerase III epsilon subunit-like protein
VKAIIFDTETTGLPKHATAKLSTQPKIIEFGAIIVEEGAVLSEHRMLINPQQPLEAIITKITGLTDEDLRDAPTFPEVHEELRLLFAGCDAAVAHNMPFDSTMVNLETGRHSLEPWPWPPRMICTVQEHVEMFGRRAKLLELYEQYMGEPLKQTHRALDDVYALWSVVRKSGVLDS